MIISVKKKVNVFYFTQLKPLNCLVSRIQDFYYVCDCMIGLMWFIWVSSVFDIFILWKQHITCKDTFFQWLRKCFSLIVLVNQQTTDNVRCRFTGLGWYLWNINKTNCFSLCRVDPVNLCNVLRFLLLGQKIRNILDIYFFSFYEHDKWNTLNYLLTFFVILSLMISINLLWLLFLIKYNMFLHPLCLSELVSN